MDLTSYRSFSPGVIAHASALTRGESGSPGYVERESKQGEKHLGQGPQRESHVLLLSAFVQLFSNFTEHQNVLGNWLKCQCPDPQRFRKFRAEAHGGTLFAGTAQTPYPFLHLALCRVVLQSFPPKKQSLFPTTNLRRL